MFYYIILENSTANRPNGNYYLGSE